MNLLGHNYIAYKVLGHSSSYTLLGSHIPDFVPFLPSSVFTFEEIHENHEELLMFTAQKYPELVDLPLSMMCHSVKYGADEYNREIDEWLLKDNEGLTQDIANEIAKASLIQHETARGPRLHNYLWCGVDLFLLKNNPDNITTKLISALESIDYIRTADVLAEFYGKDTNTVENNLRDHFRHIKPETFQKVTAFTNFWKQFLAPLNDHVNVIEGEKLLERIYATFEPHWEEIIDSVEKNVRTKMNPFLK